MKFSPASISAASGVLSEDDFLTVQFMAAQLAKARDHLKSHMLFESEAHSNNPDGIRAFNLLALAGDACQLMLHSAESKRKLRACRQSPPEDLKKAER